MLRSNFLLNFCNFKDPFTIANIVDLSWCFASPFSWRGSHFTKLHKKLFHQIKKQEEMTLYLPGPNLSGSFFCCNFMHSFAISYPENLKLQSTDKLFSTVYVLILELLLIQKILFFCFCCLWQTRTLQIISWSPCNTMWLDMSHYEIFTNAI